MSYPVLSIIIISYNTKELLEQCIESIIKSLTNSRINELKKIEIIVVDNNSKDGTREYLKKLQTTNFKFQTSFKHQTSNIKLQTILNDQNLGFAKANNQGIKIARGEYILLLNSDTKIIERDFFGKILKFLDSHPKVGILGPQLLWEDGKIQASGGYFPTLERIFFWAFFLDDLPILGNIIHSYHPHTPSFYWKNKYYQNYHQQDWITGACFFIRKEIINKIGVLDEKFFMYVEELEFCYRAKKAGFETIYYPRAKIIHLGGKSGTSLGATIGEFQGLKYFYKKHKPKWQLPILKFLLKTAAFWRFLFFDRKIYRQVLVKF